VRELGKEGLELGDEGCGDGGGGGGEESVREQLLLVILLLVSEELCGRPQVAEEHFGPTVPKFGRRPHVLLHKLDVVSQIFALKADVEKASGC